MDVRPHRQHTAFDGGRVQVLRGQRRGHQGDQSQRHRHDLRVDDVHALGVVMSAACRADATVPLNFSEIWTETIASWSSSSAVYVSAKRPADGCDVVGCVVADGRSLLDGVDITAEDFYRKLPSATTHPTTSQPSAGRFAETYTALLEDHDAIVSVHISEKLSGTVASARQAADMTDPKRVHVIDSEVV